MQQFNKFDVIVELSEVTSKGEAKRWRVIAVEESLLRVSVGSGFIVVAPS